MPYISKKEIELLDEYITHQCERLVPDFIAMTKEEQNRETHKYNEVFKLFCKLYKAAEKQREYGKEKMQEWREKNPERAKKYAREYNYDYYQRGIRRRKENN